MGKGDRIIVSFAAPPTPSLFCLSWSALSYPDLKGGNIVVTGGPTAGDDVISQVTVPGCSGGFHFGTIDLGQTGYFDQSTTFPASTVHWDGVNTLTITLGPASSGTSTQKTPISCRLHAGPDVGSRRNDRKCEWGAVLMFR